MTQARDAGRGPDLGLSSVRRSTSPRAAAQRRLKTPALLFGCAAALLGCSDKRRSTAETKVVQLAVASDRVDHGPGGSFALDAVLTPQQDGVEIRWDLGDGEVASGPEVTATYATAGVRQVTARALRDGVEVASGSLLLNVFDTNPTELLDTGITLSPLLGDVDGDGALDAADVHLVAKAATGLEPLDPALDRAADYDFDGDIDEDDADLLARAVVQGGALPTSLAPTSGTPFSTVRITSPFLQDVFANCQVRVGSAPLRPVRRIHPGYGLFMVPADAVSTPAFRPLEEGPVPVDLVVDGVTVESFSFDLRNPPAVQGDELQKMSGTFTDLDLAFAALEAASGPALDSFSASIEERAVFLALMQYSRDEIAAAAAQWDALRGQIGAADAEVLGYLFNVGGLQEAATAAATLRLELEAMESSLSSSNGAARVELLCSTEQIVEIAKKVDTALSVSAGVAAVGVAVGGTAAIGPVAPAVAAGILAVSRGISVASAVVEVIATVLPKLTGSLIVEAAPQSSLVGSDSYGITVAAGIKNVVCGTSTPYLLSKIQGLIIKKLSQRLTVWLSFGFLQQFPFESRDGALRQSIVQTISGAISSISGQVLNGIGVTEQIDKLRDSICNALLDPTKIALPPGDLTSPLALSDASAGSLTTPLPGVLSPATFTFNPPPGPDTVTISGGLLACGKPLQGSVTITRGTVPVTFCQGDNGALLDDIFELRVDGVVLLAPSQPVTSICGTVELAPGPHVVEMIGRAAPDGIGTYFISCTPFSLQGPPLSGSNLSAGTTFTWTLEVPTN